MTDYELPARTKGEQSRQRPVRRIVKIVLHNVKSYAQHSTVELALGINAICGENGAGKSTILEAIGYTLFGYRPYKLEAFLREGEKSGSIAVTVEDEDGCSFEVVRKLGSGSGQSVYNELGQRIAEGETDVKRWLLDFFRLRPGTDIARLFEDAVGPPQGTLTAIFLESAATRKQKFDRLLGIEDYRTAADNLRPVGNLFRDEAADADRRAALLEGDARRLPEVEEQKNALVARRAELGLELQGLLGRQDDLAGAMERLDGVKQRIQAAEGGLALAEARSNEARRRGEDAAAQLARAENAARIVEQSKTGFAAYQSANERLRQLNDRRQERDRLRQKAEMAGRAALQAEHRVQGFADQLAAMDRDEAKAIELASRVPEQEARERALKEAEERLRAREEAARQLAGAEERGNAAEERLREARRQLARVEEARPLAATLQGLREQEQALLAERAGLDQRLVTLKQDAAALPERERQLGQVRAGIDQVAKQIEALRPRGEVAALAGARQQERDRAANELASLGSRHEEAVRTRSQVGGGLCPFFHEPCKNLRDGVSLDSHFDGVIAATSAELVVAHGRLTTCDSALAEARAAERDVSRLPDLEANLRQMEARRAELESEVKRLAGQQAELTVIAGKQAKVVVELQALRPRVVAAEAAANVVAAESGWRGQANEAAATMDRERTGAEQARRVVEAAAGAEEMAAAAMAAVTQWGNPRADAAAIRGRIERDRPEVERNLKRASTDAANARAAEDNALKALEPFARFEEEWGEVTRQREESQAAHNLFIANQAEAGQLEERRAARARAVEEAESATKALEEAEAALRRLRTSYDEAEHARLRQSVDEVRGRIAATRTEINLNRQEEEKLAEELRSLRQKREEMEAIQGRAALSRQLQETVEALRRTLTAAGPEIARALLRKISDRATSLYRDLLGNPTVSLEWGADYDVHCRVKAEEREFKQLSGGEQMAAALAIRLALLQTISSLRVAFLDEPTAHMDAARRTNLASQIQNLRSFDQLVVISHDDSFDTLFGHVVRLIKRDGATVVEE